MELERSIDWSPAWDRRSNDPSKDYGVHGVQMVWMVRGPMGAITFVVYTNWMLPHVYEWQDTKRKIDFMKGVSKLKLRAELEHGKLEGTPILEVFEDTCCSFLDRPMAADIGYHSLRSQYCGQEPQEECRYVFGPCYYDGSALRSQDVFQVLVEHGGEVLWRYLEWEYHERFDPSVIEVEEHLS